MYVLDKWTYMNSEFSKIFAVHQIASLEFSYFSGGPILYKNILMRFKALKWYKLGAGIDWKINFILSNLKEFNPLRNLDLINKPNTFEAPNFIKRKLKYLPNGWVVLRGLKRMS
jgi:hypothetical protein